MKNDRASLNIWILFLKRCPLIKYKIAFYTISFSPSSVCWFHENCYFSHLSVTTCLLKKRQSSTEIAFIRAPVLLYLKLERDFNCSLCIITEEYCAALLLDINLVTDGWTWRGAHSATPLAPWACSVAKGKPVVIHHALRNMKIQLATCLADALVNRNRADSRSWCLEMYNTAVKNQLLLPWYKQTSKYRLFWVISSDRELGSFHSGLWETAFSDQHLVCSSSSELAAASHSQTRFYPSGSNVNQGACSNH